MKVSFLRISLLLISLSMLAACRGEAYDQWETSNNTFRVRATAYHESVSLPVMPGAFYVYESSPVGSNEWKQFLSFKVDDPNPVPGDIFRFVNNDVAYVNSYDNVVVTVDAGRTWHSSNTRFFGGVVSLKISPDGSGNLKVVGCPQTDTPCIETNLTTSNFGLTWEKIN